ncbi:MAG: threonine--tRNA ligase, partial [Alphaproteobacteria bacterium]|nr:threonine--tRNA ligase [Alphaproteobacteria bacterium]
EMLQRIYGTCWANEKDLKDYLHMLAEAEKRDHRRIGKEMNLFHLQEEAQGMVFWHEKGWTLYRVIESYLRRKLEKHNYLEVRTPQLVDRGLWEMSGHWEKFREHMFVSETDDARQLAVKPMNCPCHIEIFKRGLKSYRDLPLRMAEFGSCHRYEPSGALHGLLRVRAFTQDDAHIFCTEAQITSETESFCRLLREIYEDMGFPDIHVLFADRPSERVGDDAVWDKAEQALLDAVRATGLPYDLNPGEGAFYGPKIEFNLRDAIGRSWQCGTLQVDFNLPSRLGATYIGEDGNKHIPVLLHRAILGSLERFIGILIEQYEGKFPLWLAPLQIMVCPITTDIDDYAVQVAEQLRLAGLRVATDLRNEKINYKVREHSDGKIPVILAVGRREAENDTVSMRRLGSREQSVLSLKEVTDLLANESRPPDLR